MTDTMGKTARIPRFHKMSFAQRLDALVQAGWLTVEGRRAIEDGSGGLIQDKSEFWSENNLGTFALPWGVCLNLLIDGKDYIVPMAIEEPSVVAAVTYAAKVVRDGGGFTTRTDPSEMIAQIQYVNVPDPAQFAQRLADERDNLMRRCDEILPSLKRRGGGIRDIVLRHLPALQAGEPDMHVVHLVVDVCDAMGANLLNTLAEEISPEISRLAETQHVLRILSNLADRRLAYASCEIPNESLKLDVEDGNMLADRIELASMFAERDPYRAATHNKGIFNGVDAVTIASGNDWRQVEASCHAYAARDGHYAALATWRHNRANQTVRGQIALPLALGTVGAQIQGHGRAKLFYEISGIESSGELARVTAAVGLAQNFAAIRALSDEGIQTGHMRLHARNVALAAGCPPEKIEGLVDALIACGNVKIDEAERLLQTI